MHIGGGGHSGGGTPSGSVIGGGPHSMPSQGGISGQSCARAAAKTKAIAKNFILKLSIDDDDEPAELALLLYPLSLSFRNTYSLFCYLMFS